MNAKSSLVFPDWAEKRAAEILYLEVKLGNIPPQDEEWFVKRLDALMESEEVGEWNHMSNDRVDKLFNDLCYLLHNEGIKAAEIAIFVNGKVGYKGGPPYCDANEVQEAIIKMQKLKK